MMPLVFGWGVRVLLGLVVIGYVWILGMWGRWMWEDLSSHGYFWETVGAATEAILGLLFLLALIGLPILLILQPVSVWR
jgi:hypothetical protein